jgi:hypothetical protein
VELKGCLTFSLNSLKSIIYCFLIEVLPLDFFELKI